MPDQETVWTNLEVYTLCPTQLNEPSVCQSYNLQDLSLQNRSSEYIASKISVYVFYLKNRYWLTNQD